MNIPPEEPTGTNGEATEIGRPVERLRAFVGRLPVLTIAAVVLVAAGLSLLSLSLSSSSREHPLYPLLPTMTPLAGTLEFEPVEIGFADLNADPQAQLGRRLQVSGTYTPVDAPDCPNYRGPIIRWSLVAEELQLNAVGFETVLRLVEPGTEMIVSGIWRAYHGPVGCGKEPEDSTVWYLAVEQIIAPNPLLGATGPLLTVIPGEALPTLPPLEAATPSPTLETTATITTSLTIIATTAATLPPVATPTPDSTALSTTPLATAGSPGATPLTPSPGSTPLTTPTLGPSPTPTATGGAQGTTTPGLPTSTPSGTGYPSQGTPTATTTGGYP